MRVHFHTNLDKAKDKVFDLNQGDPWGHVPQIGSKILFELSKYRGFELEVVSVRYEYHKYQPGLYPRDDDGWIAMVELHIPSGSGLSIREWEERLYESSHDRT